MVTTDVRWWWWWWWCSLKSLQTVLQQQSTVLNHIAEKLEVTVEVPGLAVPSSVHRVSIVPPPDGGLHPAVGHHESLAVGGRAGTAGVDRPRARRSIRVTLDKNERPPSTVL